MTDRTGTPMEAEIRSGCSIAAIQLTILPHTQNKCYWRTGTRAIAAFGNSNQRKEQIMKNNYSIVQRNALVEDHLWCINSFMEKNRKLVKATGMEHDDVFQQLALRLIKAVAGYDPDKGALQQHIFAQFKYELLDCKAAHRICGMTHVPGAVSRDHILSLENLCDHGELVDQLAAA